MGALTVLGPRWRALPAALRPQGSAWAWAPAWWAIAAGAIVCVLGFRAGYPIEASLAYFGVTCAAAFVANGPYRTRLVVTLAQGAGAAVGIVLGVAVQDSDVGKIAIAALVGLVSGAIGTIGRACAAGGMMAVIGTSFGQFVRVPMPGWEQAAWYLAGTGVLLAIAVAAWPYRRDRPERAAVARVFDEAAATMHLAGTDRSAQARAALAVASQQCRAAVFDHLLTHAAPAPARRALIAAAESAQQTALAAAACHSRGEQGPPKMIAAARTAARAVRAGRPVPPVDSPNGHHAARSSSSVRARAVTAATAATRGPSLMAGLRLAFCVTIATAVATALHDGSHSFWLPLTVAVAVRPEFASVYVRTLNRLAGTVIAAVLAAAFLSMWPSGEPVALAAVLALGLGVLTTPRLYAFAVVGATCSALLSASIARPDPSSPAVRLLDTAIGAAIVIVFGYLLWPGRRVVPGEHAIRRALAATIAAVAVVSAGLLEPARARRQAASLLPTALEIESLVDDITAAADAATEQSRRSELAVLKARADLIQARLQPAASPRLAEPRRR